MRLLKKIFSSKDFWPLVVVILFGLLASFPLFGKGYFNMHDDLQMMRQLEMEKCFADLQIPCRWVPDMGYGFGFPLFNFYPPLPYLIGQGIRLLGFDFVSTAKGLFALAFLASGITMYFLAKEFFSRFGGVLSAVFYIWAPYHAVDVYVRGAMNEAWAMIWFPLILWSGYRLTTSKDKIHGWVILLALSWFGLFTSHNLMVLIFAPLFAVWSLIWFIRLKSWKKIPYFILSGIWALGLAAFFTIPALVENKFTHIDSVLVGYYDYSGHFVTVDQLLFSRFWGYGPSVWLENDGMSFQIGHIHWILSVIVLAYAIFKLKKDKKLTPPITVVAFLFLVGWGAAFLTHSRSTPIWLLVSPLKYLQFPWRFLTIPTFTFSFLVGYLASKEKFAKAITALLVIVLVAFNWNYFKPQNGKLGALTDEEKFSGAAWELQQTAGIYDYLPATAKEAPKAPQKYVAESARGEMEITDASQGTNWARFKVNVLDEKAWVRVGIMHFPGWKAYVDGKEVPIEIPDEEAWGRMWLGIDRGQHDVNVRFTNTPIRTIANTITLFSWFVLLTYPIWRKRLSRL